MARKKNRAFPRLDRKICWICEENDADSQEHSIKSSRIKSLTKAIDSKDPLMTIGKDGRLYPIQGPNSVVVKFGKTICKSCNNSFSKRFDLAYDHLINFVESNPDYFRDKEEFSWGEIYDGEEFDHIDLACYYIKNFGCRIVDAGGEVPFEVCNFLRTREECKEFSLVFFKDYNFYDSQETFGGNKLILPYAENAILRDKENKERVLYNDEGHLMCFAAVLQDGPVGAYFEWILPEAGGSGKTCFSFHSEGLIVERKELYVQQLWCGLYRFSEPLRIAKEISLLNQETEKLEIEHQELNEKFYETRGVKKIKLMTKNAIFAARRNRLQIKEREIEQSIQQLYDRTGIAYRELSRQARSLSKKK